MEIFEVDKEIEEIVYDSKKINGALKVKNKTSNKIKITVVCNVPVVRFEEKVIELDPNENKKINYTILSNLVDTHLKGEAIFTCISNSERQEEKVEIRIISGKQK